MPNLGERLRIARTTGEGPMATIGAAMGWNRRVKSTIIDSDGVPIIETKNIPPRRLRTYIKWPLTPAKLVTQKDIDGGFIEVVFYGGPGDLERQMQYEFFNEDGQIKIETLEGKVPINVGDYFAIGEKNELYPIRAETMRNTKQIVGEMAKDGWAKYKTITTVEAAKMKGDFKVKRTDSRDIKYTIDGEKGDYYVDSGERQFIVGGVIFKDTYNRVKKPKKSARRGQ